MDVDLLSKIIKELIMDQDKVVLPGLGCFVAEIVPATFSDKGYTINPPYRKLSFRSKPDMGDELIDFYVEANGLDRDMACRILGDFIAELRQVIFTKKVVVLPGLGRLRATKENNLFFIPDEDLDIYPAGVGLEPISLKTHVETPQEVAAALSDLKSIMEEPVEEPAEELIEEPAEEVVEEIVQGEVPELDERVEEHPAHEDPVARPETMELKPKLSNFKRVLVALGIILATAAALLGIYVGLSRLIPDMFDSLLYTPEELEILNYKE
jgi:nucleoid DNA-binding protein